MVTKGNLLREVWGTLSGRKQLRLRSRQPAATQAGRGRSIRALLRPDRHRARRGLSRARADDLRRSLGREPFRAAGLLESGAHGRRGSTEPDDAPASPRTPVALQGRKLGTAGSGSTAACRVLPLRRGQLVARESASGPRTPADRALERSGDAVRTSLSIHEDISERLPKGRLSRFSAPTPSARPPTRPRRSSASWCSPASPSCFASVWVSLAIAVLLAIVALSYRQVCQAFRTAVGRTRSPSRSSRRCSGSWPRPRS